MNSLIYRFAATIVIAVTVSAPSALAQVIFVPSGTVGTVTNGASSVGVGTSSPDQLLTLNSANVASNSLVSFKQGGTTFGYVGMGTDNKLRLESTSTAVGLQADGANYVWIATNGSERVKVDSSGNVGIGTSVTDQRLTVKGGGIGFDYNSSDKKLYSPTDGVLEWMTNDAAAEHALVVSHQGAKRIYLNSSGNSYLLGGNVGIGTAAPAERLQVTGGNIGTLGSGSYGDPQSQWIAVGTRDYSSYPLYLGANKYGVAAIWDSDAIFIGLSDEGSNRKDGIIGWGDDSSDNLRFLFNGGEVMRVAGTGNVGIGTTTPTQKLSVNGTIRAKEVIVETTGWSDDVFAPDYRLAPLSEVEAHIKAEKHLPDIPSAAEVAEQGVAVGDMQAKLLRKIEELTLHLIEQEKRVQEQSGRISRLESANAGLRTQLGLR